MIKILSRILVNALAIWLFSLVFASVRLDGITAIFLFGLVLTAANLVLRPLLILLGLPFNLLTVGLFSLLVNTWMVMLADAFVPGLDIPGFWLTFLAALVIYFLEYQITRFIPRQS